MLTPTGEKGDKKGRKPKKEVKPKEDIQEENFENITKKVKRQPKDAPEINMLEKNAKKIEEETVPTKAEAIVTKPEPETSLVSQETATTKIDAPNIKHEVNVEKEETKMAEESTDKHCQKLIEAVHNDETLLAGLKHLIERTDLDEIIMSLDFV